MAAASVFGLGFARVTETAAATTPEPFRVAVPQSALDDLQRRLDSMRWPERETENGWSQGVPLDRLQHLVDYWRTSYRWRRFEAQINAFPQFRTEIDGLEIPFLACALEA